MLRTRFKLCELQLRSRHYSSLVLYAWEGKASPLSVALKIKKHGAFFSHGSAMWVHGLIEGHKDIFINKEQSPKPKNSSQLSQEGIDRAFANNQRYSKLAYKYQDTRIVLLKREAHRTTGSATGSGSIRPTFGRHLDRENAC
jgi:hypothetical protein